MSHSILFFTAFHPSFLFGYFLLFPPPPFHCGSQSLIGFSAVLPQEAEEEEEDEEPYGYVPEVQYDDMSKIDYEGFLVMKNIILVSRDLVA